MWESRGVGCRLGSGTGVFLSLRVEFLSQKDSGYHKGAEVAIPLANPRKPLRFDTHLFFHSFLGVEFPT